MKLVTLLEIIAFMVMFGWFLYTVDTMMENRLIALFTYMGISGVIVIVFNQLGEKIPFLQKRLDKRICLLLIFSLILIPILVLMN
ncbi:hypothetical protein P6709_11200 [Jeotgalibacillus sp. ET6]|uniref:hypothetical protein n=1 Tax=Jeotgalibacillus sp. ET6 TaxID=3037260 RepID=UPI0024181738|nr:hypothetical protein [Jeotgalibacillus sp. ET6]MDG5472321.1 hypothetical protein [Jeotgalibacillus sp. ET6]